MNAMEELRRTAAEYVLGTLDADQRAAVREWMAADPDFAALVRLWETRFAPLHELSASARPPAGLLDEILAALPSAETVAESESQADDAIIASQPEPGPVSPPEAEPVSTPEPPAETADGQGASGPVPVVLAAEEKPEVVAAEAAEAELEVPDQSRPESPEPDAEVSVPEIPVMEERPDTIEEAKDTPQAEAPAVEAPALASEAPLFPPAPRGPPPEPIPEPAEPRNPWRVLSGVLMLAILLGGTALVYREIHRPIEKPAPPPPAAPPPAPEVKQSNGPDFFAVLHPQPMDGVALTLDPDTSEVAVLQLPAAAPEGMRYNLWVTSEALGTRRIAMFRETGTIRSEELSSIGRAGLSDAMLRLTLEPEALDTSEPTGETVFSGKAVPQ
ncbi:hypothetical protein ABLE91_19460 [Aquabacter sp. CN5-332]|uniref:hypothetical protein n=1 Tax=Aquabacter sp. CN5-332 TaxID=3156608 RepID=UPI0032B39A9E